VSYEQFDHATVNLLKSLSDGLDLEEAAAEYIIAWDSLQKAPSGDASYVLLKREAENIIEGKKRASADAYLLGFDPVGEPSLHPWYEGLQSVSDHKHGHAFWPTYNAPVGAPYQNENFPFHPMHHPLLRQHAVSGKPAFVEGLRKFVLGKGGHAQEEKEMEQAWLAELAGEKHPVTHGYKPDPKDPTRTIPIVGNLNEGMSDDAKHQVDLYERDFRRWMKANPEREDYWRTHQAEMVKRGYETIDDALRNEHFDSRSNEWMSEDYAEDPYAGVSVPEGLGHMGYMLGLEWFSPQERQVVMDAINEGTVGTEHSKNITLPDGTKVPTARFIHNMLYRMTPEMDWATRKPKHFGRNAAMRLENNETDYAQGEEGRFLQSALGKLSHYSRLTDLGGDTLFGAIRDKIHDIHGIDPEDDETIEVLENLPRFEIGKNQHLLNGKMDWNDVVEGSWGHFKGKKREPEKVRMTMDDLWFLSGYDPNTKQVMPNHPIYGSQNVDEPFINRDTLEAMEKEAGKHKGLEQQAKSIRNHLGFLKNSFGPSPFDKNIPSYWKFHPSGYSYGPGRFWSHPFDIVGGQGMSLPTYLDVVHSPHADEQGNSFMLMGESQSQQNMPNMANHRLINHFLPEVTQARGEYEVMGEEGKVTGRFVRHTPALLMQNVLSPTNVTRVLGGREGSTFKNNHTDFKHSFSPLYELTLRDFNERGADISSVLPAGLKTMDSRLSHNQFLRLHPESMYGATPGEFTMAKDAHRQAFGLGHIFHPNQPSTKSVLSHRDLVNGAPFTAGESPEDFESIMGWGGIKSPTLQRLKQRIIEFPSDAEAVQTVSMVARMLNTDKPREVWNYLSEGDYKELENYYNEARGGGFSSEQINKLVEDAKAVIPAWSEVARQSLSSQKGAVKDSPVRGVEHMLGMGGAMPALQEEQRLQDEVEYLQNRLIEPTEEDDVDLLRQQYESAKQQLVQLQIDAQSKALGTTKKTGWWKKEQEEHEDLMNASRSAVSEVAGRLKEIWEKEDPSAFDPANPDKALANTLRLFHDAERFIMSVPHEVHGVTGLGYGIREEEPQVRQAQDNSMYANIAQHMGENGYTLYGAESPEEVLDALGIENTPAAKEHARSIIDEVRESGQPRQLSTIGNLLTSGAIGEMTVGNRSHDVSHLHEPEEGFLEQNIADLEGQDETRHAVHTHGYSEGVKNLQQGKYQGKLGEWRGHDIHTAPRTLAQMMNPQMFDASLRQQGLKLHHGDIHGAKGQNKKTFGWTNATTRNYADAIVSYDPMSGGVAPEQEVTEARFNRGYYGGMPLGAVNPNHNTLYAQYNTGNAVHFRGDSHMPTGGFEFTDDGRVVYGENVGPSMFLQVPQPEIEKVFGKDYFKQVWDNATPPTDLSSPQTRLEQNMEPTNVNPSTIAASETTDLINRLMNPDTFFTKEDESEWVAPIRPMHRIFDLTDLQHLRGFSNSWAVSKWYDGKRVIIVKNGDEITVLDENNRKVSVKKKFREALEQLNDRNYTLDGILGDEELNIVDIVNYDNNNVSDMQMHERLKVLRSQFDSRECVIIPGPHDTKMTDEEGLEEAVKGLQGEHENILLRDSKSTYMRGERRHPKWVLLRPSRDYNFIILDRRGTGPYTYQLGAGPILDGSVLGNRAVEYKGSDYMDVGTARNQQKAFKVGDIVRVSISGVTKKVRGGRNVYDIHVRQIEGDGEGEGAASAESLDLLTKSFAPTYVPFEIEQTDTGITLSFNDMDDVTYKVEKFNDAWYVHSPKSTLGDLYKSDYPVQLAESLAPYWSPFVPLMMENVLVKMEGKVPNLEQQEEESAGLLEEDDEERLLKPRTKKALDLISRTLDVLAKERMTWTGPKGLGIDLATPIESPHGPTKVTDEENLPDYDPKGVGRRAVDKKRTEHVVIPVDGEQSVVLDYENDQAKVSPA
jgi:hypothetical protein